MYGQPGPLSQLDRERLAAGARYYSGIPPPHGLGLDPNDPMVSYLLLSSVPVLTLGLPFSS